MSKGVIRRNVRVKGHRREWGKPKQAIRRR